MKGRRNLFVVEHHRHHPVRAQIVLLDHLSRTASRLVQARKRWRVNLRAQEWDNPPRQHTNAALGCASVHRSDDRNEIRDSCFALFYTFTTLGASSSFFFDFHCMFVNSLITKEENEDETEMAFVAQER